MTIAVGEIRKSVSFTYNKAADDDSNPASWAMQGETIHVSAQNPDNEEDYIVEKKEVPNDGSFALAFPTDYEGNCYIEINGSGGGADSATVQIPA